MNAIDAAAGLFLRNMDMFSVIAHPYLHSCLDYSVLKFKVLLGG